MMKVLMFTIFIGLLIALAIVCYVFLKRKKKTTQKNEETASAIDNTAKIKESDNTDKTNNQD